MRHRFVLGIEKELMCFNLLNEAFLLTKELQAVTPLQFCRVGLSQTKVALTVKVICGLIGDLNVGTAVGADSLHSHISLIWDKPLWGLALRTPPHVR